MVHASVEVCWGKNTSLTHPSIDRKVVTNGAITHHSTLYTRILAGYKIDELWGYSEEGQDSPEYISNGSIPHPFMLKTSRIITDGDQILISIALKI